MKKQHIKTLLIIILATMIGIAYMLVLCEWWGYEIK